MLLGVTILGLCALGVDRFKHSADVGKSYEERGGCWCRRMCIIFSIWLGSLLIASPELLMRETQQSSALIKDLSLLNTNPVLPVAEDSLSGMLIYSREEYIAMRQARQRRHLALGVELADDANANYAPGLNIMNLYALNNANYSGSNVDAVVRYDVCVEGTHSWVEALPSAIVTFVKCYASVRHWWMFLFYLCMPLFVSVVFTALISRRLSNAVDEASNPANYCPSNYSDAGTLTLKGGDTELAPMMSQAPYPTDSLPSNRTCTNDSLYQVRLSSIDRQASSSYMQFQSRLSPLMSSEDLTENDTSPVACLSSGSIRTLGSCHYPAPEISPQVALSPVAPSIACLSGVSVLSLAMSNAAGGGTIGNSLLPPHGRGKSARRRSLRLQKQTLKKVSRERRLRSWYLALIVAFFITQLPLRISDILRNEWTGFELMDARHAALLSDICRHFSVTTFLLFPVVTFVFYKNYRDFILSASCWVFLLFVIHVHRWNKSTKHESFRCCHLCFFLPTRRPLVPKAAQWCFKCYWKVFTKRFN